MNGGTTVALDVMHVGDLTIPRDYVFRPEGAARRLASRLNPGGEPIVAPMLAYAITHPSAGTILIDTGLHPHAREDLGKDFGRFLAYVFKSLRPPEQTWESQLDALGIDPAEVACVLMTHLHVDHTSGMRLLSNARFICSRREWRGATGSRPWLKGYARGHLPDESRVRPIDFREVGEPFGPFHESLDLFDDGSIRLLSTPGHTAGHMSILLRLDGGRLVLVVGDAVYTLRSLKDERLPLLTVDDDLYRRSLGELKEFWRREPEAVLVPSHDPEAWHELVWEPAR